MEENKNEAQPKKFTYEELENIATNLSTQVQQLGNRLQEANMVNIFKRLDYLFKVVENSGSFELDFVDKCINEITEIMTPPETNTEDKE